MNLGLNLANLIRPTSAPTAAQQAQQASFMGNVTGRDKFSREAQKEKDRKRLERKNGTLKQAMQLQQPKRKANA